MGALHLWSVFNSGCCTSEKQNALRDEVDTQQNRSDVRFYCLAIVFTTCEKKQNKSESLRSVKPKMSSKSSKTWRKSIKDRGRGKPIELDDWLHIRARRVSGCHGPLCRIPLQGLNCAN